jgi:alkanesulfonate monooxygenase SsuD/methylene tetrahydromethanopterin reductase-like flavin-dependent oxidoreductase (luciferase family)
MTVTFGCQLGNGTFGAAPSPGAGLRELAQQAEASGFDSVWVIDHLVIPRRVALPIRMPPTTSPPSIPTGQSTSR